MKVLVACEFSGIVREAFRERGHDAWSCDLLPTEIPGNHIQGDVLTVLDEKWDLMIAHPPCTYLSTVGNRWDNIIEGRKEKKIGAFNFFMALINADIPRICVENPQGYVNTHYRKPDQTIHPYFFGDGELKRTCLWLKNLPLLVYEKGKYPKPDPMYICQGEVCKGKKIYRTEGYRGLNGKSRSLLRAKTYPGIAQAMASQWG